MKGAVIHDTDTCLCSEVLLHRVEQRVVVVLDLTQLQEVVGSVMALLSEQINGDVTQRSLQDDRLFGSNTKAKPTTRKVREHHVKAERAAATRYLCVDSSKTVT